MKLPDESMITSKIQYAFLCTHHAWLRVSYAKIIITVKRDG